MLFGLYFTVVTINTGMQSCGNRESLITDSGKTSRRNDNGVSSGCSFNLIDNKKTTEVRKLLGLELVSLSFKRSRLRWFRHVEHTDDVDWLK